MNKSRKQQQPDRFNVGHNEKLFQQEQLKQILANAWLNPQLKESLLIAAPKMPQNPLTNPRVNLTKHPTLHKNSLPHPPTLISYSQ